MLAGEMTHGNSIDSCGRCACVITDQLGAAKAEIHEPVELGADVTLETFKFLRSWYG